MLDGKSHNHSRHINWCHRCCPNLVPVSERPYFKLKQVGQKINGDNPFRPGTTVSWKDKLRDIIRTGQIWDKCPEPFWWWVVDIDQIVWRVHENNMFNLKPVQLQLQLEKETV